MNAIFNIGRRWVALVVAAGLLLLPGCERDEESRVVTWDGELQHVVAVGSRWYGHIPVWIGIERGIFKEYGFDVSWESVDSSMERLKAISSEKAHFASVGEIAMLIEMSKGNRSFYWVGNQDIAPGFEGLVAHHGINSFEDLKGKRIGFPFHHSVDITCRLLLKQHGLDPERDKVELVHVEVADVPDAFISRKVDAALIWEPGFTRLLEVEGANVLAMDTDTDVYERFGTMTGPDVLILGRRWVDADPPRARRFMRAYFEALAWVSDHPDDAAEIVQSKYIKQDLELIRDNLKKFIWKGADDQQRVMSDSGIFGQAEYVVDILYEEVKVIEVKPNFKEWVNMDVLPETGGRYSLKEKILDLLRWR